MYSCKQVTRLKNESFHRDLSLLERAGMRLHYWICAGCVRMARQLEFLHRASQRLFEESAKNQPPVTLPGEARKRIAKRMSQTKTDSTGQ